MVGWLGWDERGVYELWLVLAGINCAYIGLVYSFLSKRVTSVVGRDTKRAGR